MRKKVMERSYKLKDRPEFASKPKPVTCRRTDLVSEAVSLMTEKITVP